MDAEAAKLLGAEIEFFDCGDYPLKLTEALLDFPLAKVVSQPYVRSWPRLCEKPASTGMI